MSEIKIDRESAEKLLRVCLDPCGWKPHWLGDVAEKLRAALDAQQPQQPSTTAAEVRALVDEYLGAGGLFNPEMMEHEKVRDLIIRMRDMIAPLDAPQTPAQTDPKLAALLDSKWRAGDKPDEILGAWAEDFSTYKIIAPPQLRDQLLALQHRAVDALDAPQTQELVGPWTATSVPQQQPDQREEFEAWVRSQIQDPPRAPAPDVEWFEGDLQRDTHGQYTTHKTRVALAGFAAGRGEL